VKRIGKKTREWFEEKDKLIEIYKEKGITRCENDGSWFSLSFHHRPRRSSGKAEHTFERTRLLCWECHPFFENNDEADERLFAKPRGYHPKNEIMRDKNKKEKKSKKPEWERPHKCKSCKMIVSILLCPYCRKMSI